MQIERRLLGDTAGAPESLQLADRVGLRFVVMGRNIYHPRGARRQRRVAPGLEPPQLGQAHDVTAGHDGGHLTNGKIKYA